MEAQYAVIRTKALKRFLINKFFLVIIFIYISEEMLNMLYRLLIAPFLSETLHVRQMSVTAEGGSMMILALQMLMLLAATLLPEFIAGQVQALIGKSMNGWLHIDITSPILENVTNPDLVRFYYIALTFIFLGLLFLTLIPYLVSAYWYCRAVSKKVDELLLTEKAQKEAYDKQRNLLLSDIAHDIKTPITTICGYTRALADNVVTDEEKKKEYLQSIYTKSMRMDELINLLLEYVQLDSSGFALHKEKADLGEILRENIAFLYSDFEEKGMQLEIDIPEREFPYEIDKVQMSRAVVNILANAVKYSEKGTKLSVSLCEYECGESGGYECANQYDNKERDMYDMNDYAYRIRIADDGIPIDEALAEHIFEPFSRGDRARNTRGGSGLGLSISHKIVQMHGGVLKLDTKCEDGYTKAFVIDLKKH